MTSIFAILVLFSVMIFAGRFVFQYERRCIEKREELAKLLGAKFELNASSLGGIPLEEISILGANSNSRASSILTRSTKDFDSHHFLLNYSTPPGATRKTSVTRLAAVFRLKSSSLPKCNFGSSNLISRIPRALTNALSTDDEIFELDNKLVARYPKGSLNPTELRQLLQIEIPREFLPNGVRVRMDGQWLFAESSNKRNFENWIRGTTNIVEQLLNNWK